MRVGGVKGHGMSGGAGLNGPQEERRAGREDARARVPWVWVGIRSRIVGGRTIAVAGENARRAAKLSEEQRGEPNAGGFWSVRLPANPQRLDIMKSRAHEMPACHRLSEGWGDQSLRCRRQAAQHDSMR